MRLNELRTIVDSAIKQFQRAAKRREQYFTRVDRTNKLVRVKSTMDGKKPRDLQPTLNVTLYKSHEPGEPNEPEGVNLHSECRFPREAGALARCIADAARESGLQVEVRGPYRWYVNPVEESLDDPIPEPPEPYGSPKIAELVEK